MGIARTRNRGTAFVSRLVIAIVAAGGLFGSNSPAAAAGLCNATPLSGCATSGRTRLSIAHPDSEKRYSIAWRLIRANGAPTLAAFGSPIDVTSYALCIYDDGVLKIDASVPPSASKWQESGHMTAYRYADGLASADGIKRMLLKSAADGRVRIIVRSKGPNVELPAPVGPERFFNQSVSVVVQLSNDMGACWEATLRPADTVINHSRRFKSVF